MNRITSRAALPIARAVACVGLVTAILMVLPLQTSCAAKPATVIRKIAQVGDNVPVRKVDDVAKELGKSPAGRDLLQRSGSRITDAPSYQRALNRAVRETLQEAGDPALLRHLDRLDNPTKEALLVLGRGSRTIREGIPDIATRARFMGDGGANTVAALGRYGDLMPDAVRFDAALRAGRITSPPGYRALGLEDFGHFFRAQGDRAHNFWSTYVRPHWGKWLVGGALAAVLLAPDEYLDQVGDVTKEGARRIINLAGDALGGLLEGTVVGIGETTRDTVRGTTLAAWRTFFSDIWGVLALAVIIAILLILLFMFRPALTLLLSRIGLGRRKTKAP